MAGFLEKATGALEKAQGLGASAQGLGLGAGAPVPGQVDTAQKKNEVIKEICNIVKGQKGLIETEFKTQTKNFFENALKTDGKLGTNLTKLSQDVIQYEIKSSLLDNYFVQHQMIIILYKEIGALSLNDYFNTNINSKESLTKLSSGKIVDELLKKLHDNQKETKGGKQNFQKGGENATSIPELLQFFPLDTEKKNINSKMTHIIEKSVTNAVRDTLQSQEIKNLIHAKITEQVDNYIKEIAEKFAGTNKNNEAIKLKQMMLYALLQKRLLRSRFKNAIEKAIELCIAETKDSDGKDTVVNNMITSINKQVQIFFSGKKTGVNTDGTSITSTVGASIDQIEDKMHQIGGRKTKGRKTKGYKMKKHKTKKHSNHL